MCIIQVADYYQYNGISDIATEHGDMPENKKFNEYRKEK
jgi:hypothetical protein